MSTILDNPKHVLIPVIASFDSDGTMIPVYFSIEGLRIKIQKILWHTENLIWGNQYHCQVLLSDQEETVDLFFFKTTNSWTLERN